jgi:hypothetical protein
VIVDAEPLEPAASQRAQNTATPLGAELLHQSGEANEWDVLKSIVYGGLIESITSLGVVSSAAGAGAAPSKCSTSVPYPFWVTFLLYIQIN